jgi:type VI secretion system secreted protein Hcp
VTARRQYKHLVITKGIDTASTGLLNALAKNDVVSEATLMLRKAGGEAVDYYQMKLSDARVVGIDLDVDAFGFPTETVTFAFAKIDVEYKRQEASGMSSGSYTFNDAVFNP